MRFLRRIQQRITKLDKIRNDAVGNLRREDQVRREAGKWEMQWVKQEAGIGEKVLEEEDILNDIKASLNHRLNWVCG